MKNELITELWLKEVGFKSHWFAGQPNKHWLLWLDEDVGLELSFGRDKPRPWWFCWLRSGGEHTYEHFIHIRYLSLKSEVIYLVQAMTGRRWNPARHYNGIVWRPRSARREGGP